MSLTTEVQRVIKIFPYRTTGDTAMTVQKYERAPDNPGATAEG